MCRLSDDQSIQSTFPWWPFSTRRGLMFSCCSSSIFLLASHTVMHSAHTHTHILLLHIYKCIVYVLKHILTQCCST